MSTGTSRDGHGEAGEGSSGPWEQMLLPAPCPQQVSLRAGVHLRCPLSLAWEGSLLGSPKLCSSGTAAPVSHGVTAGGAQPGPSCPPGHRGWIVTENLSARSGKGVSLVLVPVPLGTSGPCACCSQGVSSGSGCVRGTRCRSCSRLSTWSPAQQEASWAAEAFHSDKGPGSAAPSSTPLTAPPSGLSFALIGASSRWQAQLIPIPLLPLVV